jgi:hypothetical protein
MERRIEGPLVDQKAKACAADAAAASASAFDAAAAMETISSLMGFRRSNVAAPSATRDVFSITSSVFIIVLSLDFSIPS